MLKLAGIKEILIISPLRLTKFQKLLGDGSHFGIELTYEEPHKPDGWAQSFIISDELYEV